MGAVNEWWILSHELTQKTILPYSSDELTHPMSTETAIEISHVYLLFEYKKK